MDLFPARSFILLSAPFWTDRGVHLTHIFNHNLRSVRLYLDYSFEMAIEAAVKAI